MKAWGFKSYQFSALRGKFLL